MKQKADLVVSDLKPEHKTKKSSRNYYPALAIFGVVIVVLAFLFILIHGHNERKNAAYVINGQITTRTEVNSLAASAKQHGVVSKVAQQDILKYYKETYVAKELDINVSSSEIKTAARSMFLIAPSSSLDPWEHLVGWEAAFSNDISFAKSGGYEGGILFFPFNQLSVTLLQGYPKPSGWGNVSDIAAAQQYAHSQAESYYNQLSSNKISLDNATNSVLSNSKLQFAGTSNGSTEFQVNLDGVSGVSTSLNSSPLNPVAIKVIKSFNKVGLTPINTQTGTYPTVDVYNGDTNIPIAYYFIDIQKVIKPVPNIGQTYSNDMAKLKVENNV
ncbi:MAG: hypothetical protein WDN66_04040 [Candidatus Saccharibacteria bacterium]